MNAPATITRPYSCGNCGDTFGSKGDKRRHKLSCAGSPSPVEQRPAALDLSADAYRVTAVIDHAAERRASEHARKHLAKLTAERRAQLEREWREAEAESTAWLDRRISPELKARADREWRQLP